MRNFLVKFMMIIMCCSLQIVTIAPQAEARGFLDFVVGMVDNFSSSDRSNKSSSYFSADMPADGSPVKLQAVGV